MRLTNRIIDKTYEIIESYHEKHLDKLGVILPKLKSGDNYTKDALTLVYLAQGYPQTRAVTKAELTDFIRNYYPDTNDVQQARHLGAQKGWFISSGTRNDSASQHLKAGEYKLETLEKAYPGFTAARRDETIGEDGWEKLKKAYDYRCACCGSKEGEKHRYWKNTTTVLQKGHKDPTKPLEAGNIIPQCEKCNRADRNYWVYDNKGRVVKIANAIVVDSCSEKIKKEMYERLYAHFKGVNPSKL